MQTHLISFSARARVMCLVLGVTGLAAAAESRPEAGIPSPETTRVAREGVLLASTWLDSTTSQIEWLLRILGASPDDVIKATTIQAKMNLLSVTYAANGIPGGLGELQRLTMITDIYNLYETLPLADVPLDPVIVDAYRATLEKMWVDLGLSLLNL